MDEVRTRWGVRQLAWLILLSGIALAGNVWAPKLFTGFNYLFGGLGVMLVLRLFGIGPALIVALLAAAWCKQLFGHYYPLLWLGLEPVLVGIWLRYRPNDSLILVDAIYWTAVGGPLVFFFFLVVLQVPLLGTLAAALMYLTIGTTNALFASLILNQSSLERLVWPDHQMQRVTIARYVFQMLMLAIVLPALLVLIVSGRQREEVVTQRLFDALDIKARQVGYEVRQKIFDGVYPKIFGPEQRAELNQAVVTKLLQGMQSDSAMSLHLLANKGEVISSTNPELALKGQYDPLLSGSVSPAARQQFYHRMPPAYPPVPLWQRAGKSSYIRVYPIPGTTIYVVAESLFAPYQAQILRGHRDSLAALMVYLAAGTVLAMLLSRRLVTPLVQLSQVTTDLPGRLLTEDLPWPDSGIVEVHQLIQNSQEMAHTLSGQFREIAQINAELEDRVEERTRELSETNQVLRQEIDERISAERQRDHLMDELTVQLRFLQTLMDAIPNPIYFKDLQGHYQGFNQAFCIALGISRDSLIGKSSDDMFPADSSALYRQKDAQLFAEGGTQQYETDFVYSDGKVHTIIVSKATYFNLSGELSGLIGVFVDITERKQAELELDQLMRELEAKNKELESIIYVSSHDLRSPLVNIQGFSRKVAKSCAALHKSLEGLDLDPEKQQELLSHLTESMPRSIGFITSSVEKMDGLLSGLLRLSRLGKAAVTLENLDMNLLISKITNSLAYQIESSGSRISVESLHPCQGDAVQVSQVFTNLLDNAIKYRFPDRPLQVRVSCETIEDNVEYCVEDNGIGIHPDYQAQVWEIFHRINPRDIPGEGLGLTVSRRILDRLNGTIRLISEEGVGSRFYVKLPAQRS